MITDIIDLLVDLSNSFGSLTNAIFARFRNYRSYILENNELSTDAVDCIINAIPEIKKEYDDRVPQLIYSNPVRLYNSEG